MMVGFVSGLIDLVSVFNIAFRAQCRYSLLRLRVDRRRHSFAFQVPSHSYRARILSWAGNIRPQNQCHQLTVITEVFAIRFFLGIFEAAMLPGVLFYLSTFYKRNEIASRLGIFYGIFSKLLNSSVTLIPALSNVCHLRCFLRQV